jgi:putative transposase
MIGRAARLAYLGVTNTFALLRLLPMDDRDKDLEILALGTRSNCCNGTSVEQGPSSLQLTERSWLPFLHRLPRPTLRRLRL